ncbi:hypothetical protein HID58_095088 [Brassica napus]|uniref:Uncharacterized protein n=1 Tax=Brassica napus TaxID=3708 RepID=A0ABQ7X7E0_BRANA|nr:hypothetical protein HID58_095088 [Brassica napus]
MAGKVYMVMALIMMGFVLQACNGMNVDVDDGDDIKPTEDSRFFCFRVCSIRCGKQNKPCYQECLPKCGLPRRLAKPTTSPSSPSSTENGGKVCNGMNVDVDDGDDIKPTEDSRFFCFRVCSIRCGKQNKPCYQECLPKCGLPRRLAKPTTSPSSPSSTVYMVMALIMMGFVLQACNGMNVDVDDGDDIKPTEDSRFFCFRVCSIRCGKQNKPCYQKCLPKCGLPRRLAKPTTSPSSPSSTV